MRDPEIKSTTAETLNRCLLDVTSAKARSIFAASFIHVEHIRKVSEFMMLHARNSSTAAIPRVGPGSEQIHDAKKLPQWMAGICRHAAASQLADRAKRTSLPQTRAFHLYATIFSNVARIVFIFAFRLVILSSFY
jgi:hypothetical protein